MIRAALALALLAAPAMAQDGHWWAFPNATRDGADEQHPTCTVDGWWSYNRACCCTHQWCAPIPEHAVREERGGYRVTLRPGDHPQVSVPATWWIPADQTGRSPDGRKHFCGIATEAVQSGRCLLIAPGGM
jgi:DNA-binding transcriptional LysR family regulator